MSEAENQENNEGEVGVVEITAKSPKTDREVTFKRNFGATLEEAVQMFGAEVVHSVFAAQAVIRAQGAARTSLDKFDTSTDDAIKAGESYTPGVVRRGGGGSKKDPFVVLAERMKSGELTQEQLMAELAKRMAS
jgi:hypothetical protein